MRFRFRAQEGLLWVGLAVFTVGFVVERLWHGMPKASAALLWVLALLGWGAGYLVARRLRWQLATSVGLVWLLGQIGFGGLGAVAAVMLLAGAAAALGSLLVGAGWNGRLSLSILVGLALILGIDGWLLPLPLHTRAFYLVLLGGLIAWRRHVLLDLMREASAGWRAAVASAPRSALFTLACAGAVSTCAWFPAIFYDAMAYHLALPIQLARFGYYQMNVATNVWALAPWASDVTQGIAWVLAGGEATGSVGLLWWIPALALVWSMAGQLKVPAPMRWMGVALYASMPLVAGLLTTMQTELPTAAVLAALAAVILQNGRVPDRRVLRVVGALSALLLALKVINVLFLLPLLAWLLFRARGRLPWKELPMAVVLAALLATSSYVYAYVLTGNPVLPVFNAFFKSTASAAVNFHDGRWDHPMGWIPIWSLVFHSGTFVEANDGAGPFVLIALAGSWLCALATGRSRGLALAGAACLALPLTQIHYLRYAMPAMVLLIPAMLAGLPVATAPRALRAQLGAMAALAWLSVLFVPGANWQLTRSGLANLIKKGREGLLERYAPERLVADFVAARREPGDRILLADKGRPFTALFPGTAYTVAWYDTELSRQVAHEGLARTVARSGANLLLVPKGQTDALAPLLRQRQASVVFRAGDVALWQLNGSANGELPSRPRGMSHALVFTPPTHMAGAAWINVRVTYGPAPDQADSWSGLAWNDVPNRTIAAWRAYAVGDIAAFRLYMQDGPLHEATWSLVDSRAMFRPDLAAERDLALRMRRTKHALKAWSTR